MADQDKLLFRLHECGVTGYRNSHERQFLEHLHKRASSAGWFADGWARDDRTIVTVTLLDEGNRVVRTTLRIDFFDDYVTCGYDKSHQVSDEIEECDPQTVMLCDASIEEMAQFAANWMESELAAHN